MLVNSQREGSLEAPTRHALDWKNPDFYEEESLFKELERVYDICHGCRRCVSLCKSFPTLFDLVDESDTMEVDGVNKEDYWKVVDHCYLCDLCYLTKCPYVPPHEWNVDFPHLMLRAKAVKYKQGKTKLRDRLITNTDAVGKLAGIPIIVNVVNAANKNKASRKLLQKTLGVHANAKLPEYHNNTLYKRTAKRPLALAKEERLTKSDSHRTRGRVALFATCYGNYNEPVVAEDLLAVYEHNGIEMTVATSAKCCGMPKLELGDLQSVEKAKQHNIPILADLIERGYDIVAPVPSCVLMFKQELPLMFPDNADVLKVKENIYDPFEYLALRHRDGLLNTDFKNSLGKVSYHVACHQRVQNIGAKTKDILKLVPETEVNAIERCSGHDGTYTVKQEFHEASMQIARPVVNQIKRYEPDYYGSDCPVAGRHLENALANDLGEDNAPKHPITLMKIAYGL